MTKLLIFNKSAYNYYNLNTRLTVVYSSIRSKSLLSNQEMEVNNMTERQRKYWRAFNKFSNYAAVLAAVKGPKYKFEPINTPNYIEGNTVYLEEKCHEMYVILKSLGAIKASNDITSDKILSKEELDIIIKATKDEIAETEKARKPESTVVDKGDDVND